MANDFNPNNYYAPGTDPNTAPSNVLGTDPNVIGPELLYAPNPAPVLPPAGDGVGYEIKEPAGGGAALGGSVPAASGPPGVQLGNPNIGGGSAGRGGLELPPVGTVMPNVTYGPGK